MNCYEENRNYPHFREARAATGEQILILRFAKSVGEEDLCCGARSISRPATGFESQNSRGGRDRYSKSRPALVRRSLPALTACLSELSLCLSERLAKLTRRNHLLATATTNSSQAREPAPRSLPTTSSVNFTAVRTAL